MKDKLPKGAQPDTLPWTVILTPLTLALASAWLVFMRGWEPWKAFVVVGLVAFAITSALLLIMVWTNPEGLAEFWLQVWQTSPKDIELLLKLIRHRK